MINLTISTEEDVLAYSEMMDGAAQGVWESLITHYAALVTRGHRTKKSLFPFFEMLAAFPFDPHQEHFPGEAAAELGLHCVLSKPSFQALLAANPGLVIPALFTGSADIIHTSAPAVLRWGLLDSIDEWFPEEDAAADLIERLAEDRGQIEAPHRPNICKVLREKHDTPTIEAIELLFDVAIFAEEGSWIRYAK